MTSHGGPPAESSERLLARLLKRVGLERATPPDAAAWAGFLDASVSLIGDLEQDRYLLEQALDTSSNELLEVNQNLRDAAATLASEREDLRRANSLLTATLESTTDGILVVDRAGRIASYNKRFIVMWGVPEEILVAGDDSRAIAHVTSQLRDPEAFLGRIRELYDSPEARSHDTLEFLDGRTVERDSLPQWIDGEIVGRVWCFRDVTARARLEEELRFQALHDPLTKLANRLLFDDHVEQALRRLQRYGGHLAIILLDIDGFKHVNDSLGHPVGDRLLVALADRFRSHLRGIDTIARLGGDEFALLVEDLDSIEAAARVGERILEALADPLDLGDRLVTVSASIGIAVPSDRSSSSSELLGNADAAMYQAKRDGKNCYRLFQQWMHTAAVRRLDLEQELRHAIATGEINVAYQPVVAASTGRLVGFEALARWNSPTRGPVRPDVFIPVAEECGLIVEVGRLVLDQACRQLRRWQADTPDAAYTVAVNVSSLELGTADFADHVLGTLSAHRIDPRLLTLEVTESILASDSPHKIRTLEHLRHAGIRIAIDDFGTGYSSLAALAQLPIDILKIDKRFVDQYRSDSGAGLLAAITQLARSLGLRTVAEGVELEAQQAALLDLGCDLLQGYLFSRPLSSTEVSAYLEREGAVAAGRRLGELTA